MRRILRSVQAEGGYQTGRSTAIAPGSRLEELMKDVISTSLPLKAGVRSKLKTVP
jgi:hypothetical protein